MSSNVDGLMSMHQRMQQWFEEGQCCDMTIKIMLGDEEAAATEEAGSSSTSPTNRKRKRSDTKVVEIKAHSVVLAARSDHICACMTRGFEESGNKTITIHLADEQELEDFRLLIKLSYSPSYIKDGDRLLDRATLIRLASVANAYEFHIAVNECLAAAGGGLSFEEAITCTDDLPENLKGTDAAEQFLIKAVAVLVTGLNYPSSIRDMEEGKAKEEMLREGADALARQLGPVSNLFAPGDCNEDGVFVDSALLLKGHVKAFQLECLERLLQSQFLNVGCEEETYLLVTAWIRQSPLFDDVYYDDEDFDENQMKMFKSLVSCLRFEEFALDYFANVVSYCPFMRNSSMLPKVMVQALVHRHIPQSIRDRYSEHFPNPSHYNGEGKGKVWKFKVEAHLSDLIGIEPNGSKLIVCGLMMGYPLILDINREEEKDTMAMNWIPDMPALKSAEEEEAEEEEEEDNDDDKDERGIGLCIEWKAGDKRRQLIGGFDSKGYGTTVFKEPWEKVVHAGSLYFPQGKMTIEATVTELVYWCEKHEDNDEEEEGKEEEEEEEEGEESQEKGGQ